MLFQSTIFIYLFFPLVLSLFLLLKKQYPQGALFVLFASSLYFCGYLEVHAVMVLLASLLFNFLVGSFLIVGSNRKASFRYLFVAIAANLVLLLWYKFRISQQSFDTNLLLEYGIPLGLSFYTLYQISFLIDLYNRKATISAFLPYAVSVSMFAHLPAGPILNYKNFIAQLSNLNNGVVHGNDIAKGLSLFMFGLLKKTFIADPLSIFNNQIFAVINTGGQLYFFEALTAVWSFMLQLYFDFSAYSDMAIGIGLCFGIVFPVNFNSPLKASSFVEYISRWHISLVSFNSEYVFYPLQTRIKRSLQGTASYRNYLAGLIATAIVFIAIAIWHATTLTFLFSGIALALILTISNLLNKMVRDSNLINSRNLKCFSLQIPKPLKQAYVVFCAAVFAVLLRVDDLKAFQHILLSFFDFDSQLSISLLDLVRVQGEEYFFAMIEQPIYFFGYKSATAPFFLFIFLTTLLATRGPNSMEIFGLLKLSKKKYNRFLWRPTWYWASLLAFAYVMYLLCYNDNIFLQNFIYGAH